MTLSHTLQGSTSRLLFNLFMAVLTCLSYTAPQNLFAKEEPMHFVVVTHGQANDPFWLRVKNGVEQAAKQMQAKVEYRSPETFDMVAMSQLIEAAIQQEPDGLVVSLPDGDALSGVISKAIQAGIPVASINAGAQASQTLGLMFHVGSDEFKAGIQAGQNMRSAGVKKPVCVNHEVGNVSLDIRCQGVSQGYGQAVKVIASPANSVEAVYATVKATLQADDEIDGIIALGATTVAEPTLKVMAELNRMDIYLGTFDLSPQVLEAIETGQVAFAIDQQQYLQGYLPIVYLSLYHRFKLLPPKQLSSGPTLITKQMAPAVIALSGQGIR